MLILEECFWLSVAVVFYVYIGYFFVLKLAIVWGGRKSDVDLTSNKSGEFPINVTVIVAAHNEEKSIEKRINNLLKQSYPPRQLEIIVASDGSTDDTVRLAERYKEVKVLDFKEQRGRSSVHNDAVKLAGGDIIIFTDAETEFDQDFVAGIVKNFFDSSVGCVVGNLIYRTQGTSISVSEGFYWKFEKKLREVESKLGILTTATGACMAVKKKLWVSLDSIYDCDDITPLDVILQGYQVIYAPEAVAYDIPPSSIMGELKARIRMTAKQFNGALVKWGWKGWIQHPFHSYSLLSHKILRSLSPFFFIFSFFCSIFLFNHELVYRIAFLGYLGFYLLALTGLFGELLKIRIPIASLAFSFCLANIGMGTGVVRAIIGKTPTAYKPVE